MKLDIKGTFTTIFNTTADYANNKMSGYVS